LNVDSDGSVTSENVLLRFRQFVSLCGEEDSVNELCITKTLAELVYSKFSRIRHLESTPTIFKYQQKLIQVELTFMDRDSLFMVFTDLTKIRELEGYVSQVKNLYQASVAHELRTPINSILPMAEALKEQISDERHIVYLEVIIASSKHLQGLIDDALDMSRIENGAFSINPEWVDPREGISEVADCMQFQIERKELNFETEI